jgi:hypothetical protein
MTENIEGSESQVEETSDAEKEFKPEPVVYVPGKWTPEMEDLILTYIEDERNIDDIVTAINSIFTGVNMSKEAVILKRAELIERDRPNIEVIKYLSIGRTVRETANHFKLSLTEAEDLLKADFDGYDIWPTQDESGEIRHILLPELPSGIKVAPRIWKLQLQPKGQPWIWIRFPKNDWDQIKVVPLSDVHYGAKGHRKDKFVDYVEWIKQTPNAFTFINGDLLENALRDSVAGAIYESKKMPKTQLKEMIEILAPIAHKILWAIPGNHEDRSRKHVGFDPLEWICDVLNIPFFNDAINATIWWGDHRWEFYARHGNTNSATKGGKLNAAKRVSNDMEYVHFYIMGHVHDAMTNKIEKHVRNFKTFEMELKTQYIVTCGSFYGYWGTYASKSGLSPASEGMPTCRMFPDGDHKADVW